MAAQRIKVAATRAFRSEGVVGNGRTVATQGKSAAGIGRQHSQPLRCYADQPILLPNSSWTDRQGAGEGIVVRRRRATPSRARLSAVLALLLLVAPLMAAAQQGARIPRIGILWVYSPSVGSVFADAFRQGLRGLGYVEGRTIVLEERWAEGKFDRLPSLAGELVRLNVDVILTASTPAAQAAQQATRTIPIVITLVTDPVESGIVASLARPGGNITGLSLMHPELTGKRLELLKEVIPKVRRVGVFWSASTPSYQRLLSETETAARSLGLQLHVVEVRGPTDFDNAFSAIARGRVGALVLLPDVLFRNQQKRILDLASKHQLPAMYWSRELVDAGGLMAYGANIPDQYRQAATVVDKILKGAKPGDLPIEQPAKLELVINVQTAKALGLTIPQSVLLRADHVVE
jgi:putative ABC transport system substrate-binding protein